MAEETIDQSTDIKRLIAENEIGPAIEKFLGQTSSEDLVHLHNEGVKLLSRYNQYKKDMLQGIVGYDAIILNRNQINHTLLQLVDELPSQSEKETQKKKRKGIRESRLKKHIRTLMVIGKTAAVLFLIFLWDSGGFSVDQFIGTLTLLLPLFTTYTVLMFRDKTKFRYVNIKSEDAEMLVTRSFQRTAYFWIISYTLVIISVLYLKPPGLLSYTQMSTILTGVEVGMGVYIGEIVFALFRK